MILILGGRGLMGSAFVRACERASRPFAVIDRQNYAEYAGSECDLFVNANGNSSKLLSRTEPLRDFDANVRTVRSTLADFRSRAYLHLSSCDVYPDCSSPLTTTEDSLPDPARQSPYGFHKYLAEQCVRHGAAEWLIFRLGGLLGPGLKKNAIFDILNGGPLWLDPDSSLQFMNTDKAAELMLDIADRGITRRTLNLCGDGVVQLRDVVDFVARDIPVKPGSPTVRYEVSVAEVAKIVDLPKTRDAVFDFVRSYARERGADG